MSNSVTNAVVQRLRRWRAVAAAIVLAILLVIHGDQASAASCAGADTVKNAARAFIGAARAGTASAFSSVLARYSNVESVALFALGTYRKDLPPARRGEYVRSAQRYLSQFLADNAGRFNRDAELTVESCKGNLIETSFDGQSGIVWRISGSKVQDVRVSGVWLTLQLKSKFTDIIRSKRGHVTGLLDFLARPSGGIARPKQN